ncbi:MAG: hypothetical protein ACK4ZU_15710 [Allorhizobium sp.]
MADNQLVERLALSLLLQFAVQADKVSDARGLLQFLSRDRWIRTIDQPQISLQLALHLNDGFQGADVAVVVVLHASAVPHRFEH